MRLEHNYLFKLLLLTLVIGTFSCETDEYPILLGHSDKATLGELKSLEISSGNNRVLVQGVVEDPNVSEVRIYWDDRSGSVVVPVSGQGDTINEMIEDLEERLYIFEVQTFDDAGNSSKVISAGAEVFGSDFANSAGNREVISGALRDSLLEVTYGLTNRNSGVIGTEFTYESTSGEDRELFVNPEENFLSIPDFKSGSTFSYRTLFVPSLMAIDTIYTDYAEYRPVPLPQLKNASAPFEASETSGRWGTLADWISNEAIKNHDGYGGWDSRNGFNIESGWGAPAIINGEIYQTVEAEAAKFTLLVEFNAHNHSEDDEGGFYIVIAKGDGLPDVEDIATAPEVLGYARVVSGVMNYSIDFTVDETMEISVGVVTTQDDSGRYGPINSFEIGPGSE